MSPPPGRLPWLQAGLGGPRGAPPEPLCPRHITCCWIPGRAPYRLLEEGRRGGREEKRREERERGREGGRRGEEGGWRHPHRVNRAAPPPPPPAHRHRIPWERAPSAAVCKQSLPLWCRPVFRHWPSSPHGNPRPSLGQGLADVCEKGRLPLAIRILHTMGRNSHQTQGQRAPTGLGHGSPASPGLSAGRGSPWATPGTSFPLI